MRITKQNIENLKGEIEFRAKLAEQHTSGKVLLPDYYTKEEHDRILLERIETTRRKMAELTNLDVCLSPFLELGAERGQRSLVLQNEYGAEGVAVDISYHQLRTMEYFSELFAENALPMRICCDANHLPFRSNSFPFIFCYQFLHHFPSLNPIISEIYRVLSDGYFFFDEEPFKRILKIVLYRQKSKIYSKSAFRKNSYMNLIESFISKAPCDEVEHGIIENNDISLREWIEALSIFDEHNVDLFSINNLTSKLNGRLGVSNFPNWLLGGIITGVCIKKIQVRNVPPLDLSELLGCPDCEIPSDHGSFDRPLLIKLINCYKCPQCGFEYPIHNGILFLLPRDELRQLYPDFFLDTASSAS